MIRLEKMTAEDFEIYQNRSKVSFATQLIASSGLSQKDAESATEKSWQRIMPNGFQTPNMHLFRIMNTEEHVGNLHLEIRQVGESKEAFGADFEIFEKFRRMGFAREVLKIAGKMAKELGCVRATLHVFGHNVAALPLYQELGFRNTSYNMSIDLIQK